MNEKEISKKLVFNGKLFRVWHLEVELEDGTRASREHIERKLGSVVGVFLDRFDKDANVYLIREFRSAAKEIKIGLPGGRFDPSSEAPGSAMTREMREEVGLRPQNIEKLFEYHGGSSWVWHQYFYLCTEPVNDPLPHDNDERLEVINIPFVDLFKEVWAGKGNWEASNFQAIIMIAKRLGLIEKKE